MWMEYTTCVSFQVRLYKQKIRFPSLMKQAQTQQKVAVAHRILKLSIK